MMTDRIVFKIFEDYLNADTALEVVKTKHGYAVMLWDAAAQDCPHIQLIFLKCQILKRSMS